MRHARMLIAHPQEEERIKLGALLTGKGHLWFLGKSTLMEVLGDPRALFRNNIQLVITASDMSLVSMQTSPGADGRAITEMAKEADPEVKVVVLYRDHKPDYGDAQIRYDEGIEAVAKAIAGF